EPARTRAPGARPRHGHGDLRGLVRRRAAGRTARGAPAAGAEGTGVRSARGRGGGGRHGRLPEPGSDLPQRLQRLATAAVRSRQVPARPVALDHIPQERAGERVLRHPQRHGGVHPRGPGSPLDAPRRRRELLASGPSRRPLSAACVASRLPRSRVRGRGAGLGRRDAGRGLLMLRVGLRWKILLLTALPLLALAAATLWFVDRGVSARSQEDLTGDLRRAADLFENMLSASAAELSVTGAVIVRDPRFFSVLALPHGRHDREFLATVAGVARDFQQLAHPDVFEIVDSRGDVVASVGRMSMVAIGRDTLVTSALAGRAEKRALSQRGAQVLLVGTPVVADDRVVGALLLGREISGALAARLRELTSSEVTFLSDRHITRTTLTEPVDREVARRAASGTVLPDSRPIHDGGWIAQVRPLPMAAEPTQQVYVLQRSLEAETAFLRSVRSHLLELGLLLLAAVTAAALFIAGHITHPIRQLVLAASAMERGEWEARIDRDREDEMGYLATSFDDMRRRQRTYVRSLQEVARAKSEFIAVASHELRTPISIIRGWEDLLRGGLVKP